MSSRLLALSAFQLGLALDHTPAWEEFQASYGKRYSTPDGEAGRKQIFTANVDFIAEENAKGHSYVLSINKFADMTHEEFVAERLGYQMPAASALYEGAPFLGNHSWNGEALPSSVDWSSKGAVTPIKDQGQCGSCWTFSATGALEGAYQIASKSLVSLSEQQVVDCDHGFLPPTLGCGGGSVSAVFKYARANALCSEASYPYEAKNGKCRSSGCTKAWAQGRVSGYKGLAPVARLIPASLQSMMSAVAQQPVSVALEADQKVFHFYKSGVVTGACGQMPDHAVLVVGYGTDASLGDYWKVKNSWGADWGEAGYVRITRGSAPVGRGECAILNSPSYPVISMSLDEVVV